MTADGEHVLIAFANPQDHADIKARLDALWSAREQESWTGEAPGPGADEEALPLNMTGTWSESNTPFLPERAFLATSIRNTAD